MARRLGGGRERESAGKDMGSRGGGDDHGTDAAAAGQVVRKWTWALAPLVPCAYWTPHPRLELVFRIVSLNLGADQATPLRLGTLLPLVLALPQLGGIPNDRAKEGGSIGIRVDTLEFNSNES